MLLQRCISSLLKKPSMAFLTSSFERCSRASHDSYRQFFKTCHMRSQLTCSAAFGPPVRQRGFRMTPIFHGFKPWKMTVHPCTVRSESKNRVFQQAANNHSHSWLPALVLCLSLLNGCGSTPSGTSNLASEQESAEARVIPPQVQTLYEQAVASMAAGDDMDASLRFQEFLLQYPDYSGAHINLAIIHARNGDDVAADNVPAGKRCGRPYG